MNVAAAMALAEVDSPEAASALTIALDDPAAEVRSAAALSLASLRDPASIPALARIVAGWTDPPLERCRRAALRTLVAFRSEQAAVELAQTLATAPALGPIGLEERSALLAVVYAETTGVAAPRVVRTLVALLAGQDPAADRAAVLLELFPSESRAPLARTLRAARGPEVRRRAAAALHSCRHDDAVSVLVAALRDEAPEVRAAAARSLGEMRDPVAADALWAATGDPDEDVRSAANTAVSSLGAVAAAAGIASGRGPVPLSLA